MSLWVGRGRKDFIMKIIGILLAQYLMFEFLGAIINKLDSTPATKQGKRDEQYWQSKNKNIIKRV